MQPSDETRIGKFAQQRERAGGVDALVIRRFGRNLDPRVAGCDAIDVHQPRPCHGALAQVGFKVGIAPGIARGAKDRDLAAVDARNPSGTGRPGGAARPRILPPILPPTRGMLRLRNFWTSRTAKNTASSSRGTISRTCRAVAHRRISVPSLIAAFASAAAGA